VEETIDSGDVTQEIVSESLSFMSTLLFDVKTKERKTKQVNERIE